MENIKKHLSLLGLKAKDVVTGKEGVIDSISFDLYGCIQASMNPGLDKDKKQMDYMWFDVSRIKVLKKTPVMEQPDYDYGKIADGAHGPATKSFIDKN